MQGLYQAFNIKLLTDLVSYQKTRHISIIKRGKSLKIWTFCYKINIETVCVIFFRESEDYGEKHS